MSQYKSIVVTENEGVTVATLVHEKYLDEARITELRQEVLKMVDDLRPTRLVLDFSRVVYVSSSILGGLLQLNKKCKAAKITLVLGGIIPEIFEIFRITRLHPIFVFQSDLGEAVRACKEGTAETSV